MDEVVSILTVPRWHNPIAGMVTTSTSLPARLRRTLTLWDLVPSGGTSALGLGSPGQGVVAQVAGEDVTRLEVQREARQMLKQQFPRGGAQASTLLPFFTSRAAENLINRKVVLAEAERLGLRATDEELRDELQHGRYAAAFFPGGN